MSTDTPSPEPETERRGRRRRDGEAGSLPRADRRSVLRPGEGPMVIFDNVTKSYGDTTGGLREVSLSIDAGEFVFLVGPSGSGKSTFIRLLIKELDATQGTITVGAARNLSRLAAGEGAVPAPRHRLRVPGLQAAVGPHRVRERAYALQVIGENPRGIRRKVPEILSLVGLSEKSARYPNELSGGEQQRVSIARAFVNHPRLLIAASPRGTSTPRLHRHHAAAEPHQPHRHHGDHGHP